jgi:hypothetical protein
MKKLFLNNSISQMWKEATTPLDYFLALWVTSLAVLAIGGWLTLVVHWIMNPNMWDGVQFGIYDTLGT